MTSVQIADKADMKERYVREWLGSMVAAQIVLLDGDQYSIPHERHDSIKGATAWADGALVWFKRFDQTKDCFRKNGPWGKDYDADDQFWQFYGGFREKTGDDFLDKVVLPCLDVFPQSDIKGKLDTGVKVLDVACGSGKFTMALAKRFPKSTFTGLDFSKQALKLAEEHQGMHRQTNLHFKRADVYELGKDSGGTYDLITLFDALHDLPDPTKALINMSKALKGNGKIMIVDIIPHSKQSENAGNMTAAMFYTCSLFCCLQNSMMAEPRIGYGACWGKERMTETISEVLKLEKTFELPMCHCLFICPIKIRSAAIDVYVHRISRNVYHCFFLCSKKCL